LSSEQDLAALKLIGRLLEEAIGLADVHRETLIAVHIDQAIHALEQRVEQIAARRPR